MLFGIFPGDDRTSWEGHLTGLLVGVGGGYLHMHYFGGMIIERPDLKYDVYRNPKMAIQYKNTK